ncbi:hypothetical protein JJQ72_18980 [Paenibacillus sp. F411]|uniref:hypothetical protein n=1 Tax=Paenibacillus sp. F411 TaxID=2820239 RepID=UPI001AAEFD71|nr:hypothetical protein [Paenibacillus sp. F411]MBO2946065.1 hypothetical protein [Paenibacillus sp. F411]
MNCPICGQEQQVRGAYCEKCGAMLSTAPEVENSRDGAVQPETVQAEAPELREEAASVEHSEHPERELSAGQTYYSPSSSVPAPVVHTSSSSKQEPEPSKAAAYLDQAKDGSRIYISYALEVLKSPLAAAQRTGSEQLVNGVISIVLFTLLIPLLVYIMIGSNGRNLIEYSIGRSPFTEIVLKPWFWLLVLTGLSAVYTAGAVKLSSSSNVHIKEVIARYGTLLVPFIALMMISSLLISMGTSLGSMLLIIGLVGAYFTVPALIITGYFNQAGRGNMDVLYSILLVYAALLVTIMLIGRSLMSMIVNGLGF